MVHKWFTEFNCICINANDVENLERPSGVASEEMIDKIYVIMLEDCPLKIHEIAEIVNIF